MGNKNSCCVYHSPKNRNKKQGETYVYQPRPPVEEEPPPPPVTNEQNTPSSLAKVPHISEREPSGTFAFLKELLLTSTCYKNDPYYFAIFAIIISYHILCLFFQDWTTRQPEICNNY